MNQLRLTFKEQGEGWDHTTQKYATIIAPLAFAQTYEPGTKSFESKQKTQDKWAYGDYGGEAYRYQDGKVWCIRTHYDRGTRTSTVKDFMVEEYLQPRIIDNVPMEGFRVEKSVSRYSTSNKLWRILDPRGFELEISTQNLEDLMMDCVIDHGLIMASCVWDAKGKGKIKLVKV